MKLEENKQNTKHFVVNVNHLLVKEVAPVIEEDVGSDDQEEQELRVNDSDEEEGEEEFKV